MKDEIKILDAVAVIEDLPEFGLKRGEVGTVVDTWKDGAFEVEFSDESGEAYALRPRFQAEKIDAALLSSPRSRIDHFKVVRCAFAG